MSAAGQPGLPELIDSHCHLNYDYAPKSVDDLVREAVEAGVSQLVTIGVDLPSIQAVQAISDKYANVFHTVGVHPHEASSLGTVGGPAAEAAASLALVREAARHPKCRAIGEIGLDYHYDHSPRLEQRARLDDQLAVALELGLPIVIHSREGEADLLEHLKAYASRAKGIPGVLHCFTGTVGFGQACVDLGFLVSFSGILTFKKAEEVRDAARAFPLERLLVETDSPYLAPLPFRGRKCEPAMVRHTATELARVKGVSVDEVARATTANARAFFKTPPTHFG